MSLNRRLAGEDDPEVAQALKNFKASVDAWVANRPRRREAGPARDKGWCAAAGGWRQAGRWDVCWLWAAWPAQRMKFIAGRS